MPDEQQQQELRRAEIGDRSPEMDDTIDVNLDHIAAEDDVAGGDPDTDLYQAEVAGDEAVGGTAPTPDQDIVEEVAASVGLQFDDRTPVQTIDTMDRRDDGRWELDPKSSEDYEERRD